VPIDVVGPRNWLSIVEDFAAAGPDRLALVDDDRRTGLTYGVLVEQYRYLAGVLRRHGVTRGTHVLVYMGNGIEHVLALMATHHLGGVVVTCNAEYSPDEVAYQVEHSDATLLLADAEREAVAAQVAASNGCPHVALRFDPDVVEWAGPSSPGEAAALDPADVATILYTSGTTARPKGVVLTHGNYVFVGEVLRSIYAYGPDDVALLVFPLYLTNGHNYQLVTWLTSGATVVVIKRFSVSRFAQQLARHQATVTTLNSAHVKMLLSAPPSEDERRHRLRFVKYGTAAFLDLAHIEEFEARYGTKLRGGTYSQTETVAHNLFAPDVPSARHRAGGIPALGYRIKLESDGVEVGPGEPGEICVSSISPHGLCAGYYKDPEATAHAWNGTWWRTGDLGVADEAGYVTFLERAGEMIKRAGYNVAPAEVERVLALHPAVREACVIGVVDPVKDQAIHAVVVMRADHAATGAELQAHCADWLAAYKVPSSVEIVDELPHGPGGKLDRKAVRGRLALAGPGRP
jgi:crotonobetaine/carnitine-CoA ligase